MSDESIALRHGRSEREENKRFMTFANATHQSRIRQNRRIDSRADSGANTPGIIFKKYVLNNSAQTSVLIFFTSQHYYFFEILKIVEKQLCKLN